MFEIKVNGLAVQLLQPVEGDVLSLSVLHNTFILLRIDSNLRKPIEEWLYDIVTRCSGIITYQNVIIEKDSVNKPN